VASIFGYFDESGKFKDHRVVSFCGVVVSFGQIGSFDKEWNAWLRQFGMPHLSMKQALRCKRPLGPKYACTELKDRVAALQNFANVIVKHTEVLVCVAVDVRAFQRLNPETKRLLGKDPHYTAFSRSISEMAQCIPSDRRGSIICDDEEKFAIQCYKLYARLKNTSRPNWERFDSISFADDTAYPCLQAADMLSSLTRLEAQRQFLGVPYDYQQLTEYFNARHPKGPQARGGFFGANELTGLALQISKENKRLKGNALPLADS
jgi:hypothetical protein